MGNSQGSPQHNYDARDDSGIARPPSMVSSSPINSSMDMDHVKAAFRSLALEGALNKTQFNEALNFAEDFGLRRLRDTPLGDRLFVLFDTDNSGFISEANFCDGMKLLLKGTTKEKMDLTFRCYDSSNTGYVSKEELVSFLIASWLQAWGGIADRLSSFRDSSAELPSPKQIRSLGQNSVTALKEVVQREFDKFDINRRGRLNREEFQMWASTDRTVKVAVGSFPLQVATTFMNIEKPAYPSLEAPKPR
eukprot:GEMP01037137.1.p1 GENE.GEMP01037137.1~~GEMP01037137.1.p1  ORF type:complete len:249 (+),score=49.28 GEMP01037137.1:202-948(+)